MSAETLPPCGLYRTTREVAGVPKDRLVYFHNHGEPGAGLYLPSGWKANRAQFAARGYTLTDPNEDVTALSALAAEGFYHVVESFHCCEKQCRVFETDTFVQLGYNGAAAAILFVPELHDGAVRIPERGTRVDEDRVDKLRLLKLAVPRTPSDDDPGPGVVLH
jgi:hypothetical protein